MLALNATWREVFYFSKVHVIQMILRTIMENHWLKEEDRNKVLKQPLINEKDRKQS